MDLQSLSNSIMNEITNLEQTESNNNLENLRIYLSNNFNKVIKIEPIYITQIINSYLYKLKYDSTININNYKKKNRYIHLQVIYKYLKYINCKRTIASIITNISETMNGQHILTKIPDIINELIKTNIKFCFGLWGEFAKKKEALIPKRLPIFNGGF